MSIKIKCWQCKQDKSEEFLRKAEELVKTAEHSKKECSSSNVNLQTKRYPHSMTIMYQCRKPFIADAEYQKLMSDKDLKVWNSKEMPPPLNEDILKFWEEGVLMELVKDVLPIDEYKDGKSSATFQWVWIVADHCLISCNVA